MSIKRFTVGTAAVVLAFACTGVASAHTADTQVGRLTATQVACNDFGAVVDVSVAGGFGTTAYRATAPSPFASTSDFTTNAAGAGAGSLTNVLPPHGFVGTATVTVAANGKTGQVTVAIDCPDGKGD